MNWIIILLIVLVFISIICTVIYMAIKHEKKIYNEGIEANSVVSKIERNYDTNNHRYYYLAYVKYIGDDNIEHEALLNVKTNFPYGRKIKIKYLPPKYDYAVFVSQELDEGEINNEV